MEPRYNHDRPPITADEVYVAVLDAMLGDGQSFAAACQAVARVMDVDADGVRATALAIARREDALDLFDQAAPEGR